MLVTPSDVVLKVPGCIENLSTHFTLVGNLLVNPGSEQYLRTVRLVHSSSVPIFCVPVHGLGILRSYFS